MMNWLIVYLIGIAVGIIIDNLFEYCEKLKDASRSKLDPNGHHFYQKTCQILGPTTMEDPLSMLLRWTAAIHPPRL